MHKKIEMSNHRLLSNVFWATCLFINTAAETYGTAQFPYSPWLSHNKPSYPINGFYPEQHAWHPVPGPYTYGPAPDSSSTLRPLQQQIVHIHDGSLPEFSQGDNYHEGNDYNVHNIISHVDTPYDLAGVASSKVEVRKSKPKTSPKTTPVNRKTNSNKSRKVNTNTNVNKRDNQKSREKQTSKSSRRQPMSGGRSKTSFKSNSRRSPNEQQQQQRRRQPSQKRQTRPTRRTHYRRPYYDYDDYNEYYDQRRRRGEHNNDFYNDYVSKEKDSARQEYYDEDESTESSASEESTELPTSLTTATTDATDSTESTEIPTTTQETTSGQTENPYDPNFQGYGPSNGNENISITYAPSSNGKIDPFPNVLYTQREAPGTFNYRNYFWNNGFLQ